MHNICKSCPTRIQYLGRRPHPSGFRWLWSWTTASGTSTTEWFNSFATSPLGDHRLYTEDPSWPRDRVAQVRSFTLWSTASGRGRKASWHTRRGVAMWDRCQRVERSIATNTELWRKMGLEMRWLVADWGTKSIVEKKTFFILTYIKSSWCGFEMLFTVPQSNFCTVCSFFCDCALMLLCVSGAY